MNNDWKTYENLVANVQRELSPGAQVSPNVRVDGRRSGTKRQVDILVEQKVGQFDLRIAIDCKDYRQPVDVKDVEEVIGLIEDIGANKGAIVAAQGFTQAAKKRGADSGLDLFRLVDAAKHKWQSYLTVPAVTRDLRLRSFSFRIQRTGLGASAVPDQKHFPVYRENGVLMEYAYNLILDRWKDGAIPKKVGEYRDLPLAPERMFLKGTNGLTPATILFSVQVAEELRFGQIPLVELRGFRDEVSGLVHTNGFTTDNFDFERIDQEWAKIGSIEQLAVRPVIILEVSSVYPRYIPDGDTS